jgi:hypothetical protein
VCSKKEKKGGQTGTIIGIYVCIYIPSIKKFRGQLTILSRRAPHKKKKKKKK